MSLRESWSRFLCAILTPQFLCLLAAVLALGFALAYTDRDDSVQVIALSVLLSFFSGLAGSHIQRVLAEASGNQVLQTRGKSAIRGITLILQGLQFVEKRLNKAKDQLCQEGTERLLMETLVGNVVQLQEHSVNAVEEWKDIVPEADLKGFLGQISKMNAEKVAIEKELALLSTELDNTRNESSEERRRLIEEREKLEASLFNKEAELMKLRWGSPLSGLAGTFPVVTSGDLFNPGSVGSDLHMPFGQQDGEE